VDRPVAVHRLASAAQDDSVPGPQSECSGIRSYIGTAFINDAQDTDRYAHAAHDEAIGLGAAVYHVAHGIIQNGYLINRIGNRSKTAFVQLQPVEHRGREACLCPRFHIQRVRRNDALAFLPQRRRRCLQRGCLGRVGRQRKHPGRRARLRRHLGDQLVRNVVLGSHGETRRESAEK
jgi:hypothetical protein